MYMSDKHRVIGTSRSNHHLLQDLWDVNPRIKPKLYWAFLNLHSPTTMVSLLWNPGRPGDMHPHFSKAPFEWRRGTGVGVRVGRQGMERGHPIGVPQ